MAIDTTIHKELPENTFEKLFIPRYKVIADFPFYNPYKVGAILTDDLKNAVLDENGVPQFQCNFADFPHIFRKLEWWQHRKEEQMPPYLRWILIRPGVTQKAEYDFSNNIIILDGQQMTFTNWIIALMPATRRQYDLYRELKGNC